LREGLGEPVALSLAIVVTTLSPLAQCWNLENPSLEACSLLPITLLSAGGKVVPVALMIPEDRVATPALLEKGLVSVIGLGALAARVSSSPSTLLGPFVPMVELSFPVIE